MPDIDGYFTTSEVDAHKAKGRALYAGLQNELEIAHAGECVTFNLETGEYLVAARAPDQDPQVFDEILRMWGPDTPKFFRIIGPSGVSAV